MFLPTDLRAAARDTAPIGLGYIPLGLAFGLFAVSQGFEWWMATLTAVIVYSGAMEFIAVGLITGGASVATAALTAFFVSFRHIFYGLSVSLRNVSSPLAKVYAMHALTDEAYAVLSHPRARAFSGGRVVGISFLCQVYWVVGTTAGALLGEQLPWDLSWMGFTLTALFVVLSIDAMKSAAYPLRLVVIAVASIVLAYVIHPAAMMVIAMMIYASVALVGRRWLT